ncbi:hydrogenase maturation nickel metallochaperone HypA [uncultured Mailhella sp.]|uniref:hydrogenase maturation nickel metallochaperone HypA/HybF n=1 Tax=uncultured Mailhella sp. TaxID=1981031 RepID=UPI0025CC14B0|nr:hydrogenase maturation nickel metallochaperone HypA [uncultured Mailhella sp.]
MHELSLMASVMDIAREELSRHGASRLLLLRIRYGVLDQVQPEAMRMAFEAMTAGTPHEGATLELVEEPLGLRCSLCGHVFHPEDRNALYAPCPACGDTVPFSITEGEGIFLDHLEAE